MLFGPIVFRALWRALGSILFALALVTIATGSARAGTIRLEPASGARAPLELRAEGGGSYAGEMALINDGKDPLVVSRITVRGDASDPRVPPKVSVRAADGALPITVPPGGARKALVRWVPERGVRGRQLFGHVVVTTSDEASGEVALGIRAQMPGLLGPFESHVLTLLLAAPLLGAIVTFIFRLAGVQDDRTPRFLAIAALAVQTLIGIYIYRGFDTNLSRVDGNDGLQFVEHVVGIRAIGSEIYLGVDGIAAMSILVVSGLALLSLVSARAARDDHSVFLLLNASLLGLLVAMDGLLFVVFVLSAVVAASLLLPRQAALRLLVPGLVSTMLLAGALIFAARQADPTFLVDGTRVTRTFSLPELSRVAFTAKGATVFGLSLSKVAFGMVLAASLFFLAAFPFHRWLDTLLASASPATSVIVASSLPTIGLAALMRIGCSVLPEGMRWGSGVVVALGAVSAAYGSLSALGHRDLRRLTACAATTQAGFVLLGAGSLTPEGLSGAVVLGGTRGLACGVFLLLASAIEERAKTTDASRLAGVGSQMPGWALALAAAGLGQAGLFGLGGAWGPLLAVLGVLSGYAPLAIVAALALILLGAAHLTAVSRIAFGTLDPEWEKSVLLEPFGGKFPDLSRREWPAIGPLVLLVIVLGLWPAPVIAATTGTVRDIANAVSPPGPDQVAMRSAP
jgi:NADH-quinone oxidoreductase subunit M